MLQLVNMRRDEQSNVCINQHLTHRHTRKHNVYLSIQSAILFIMKIVSYEIYVWIHNIIRTVVKVSLRSLKCLKHEISFKMFWIYHFRMRFYASACACFRHFAHQKRFSSIFIIIEYFAVTNVTSQSISMIKLYIFHMLSRFSTI